MLRRYLLGAAAVGAFVVASPGLAATQISWSVLSGGAVGAVGPNVVLQSTAGQGWAQSSAGPTILVASGFWGGVAASSGAPIREFPSSFRLRDLSPNPVRGELAIHFDVPARPGRSAIRIFDVNGRLVRVLRDQIEPPGAQVLRWDRMDGQGHRVPGGVYVVDLVAPGFRQARKVVALP
ncbi:MAG: hypothetical protein IT349_17800 [Candidatus Eisenbacteria bacterium]|nr:hypothetical protein [Candidatus Eisenbacteria bacterium]MCC7143956.1 hypothetical protein [Candidatus Eisenbacteria bacterium]